MRPLIHRAFDIVTNRKKLTIDREWLAQYDEMIKDYTDLDWYYALIKRYYAYNSLASYFKENYNINSDHVFISPPNKKAVIPDEFFNFLGDPPPEYKLFLSRKITKIYFKHGIITEQNQDLFLNKLHEASEIEIKSLFIPGTGLNKQECSRYIYYPLCHYRIINKQFSDMINAYKNLIASNSSPLILDLTNAIKEFKFIENECDENKNDVFFSDLVELMQPISRGEYMRELAYRNDRAHYISTCADIITGGILDTRHEIKTIKYDDKLVSYITDHFSQIFYETLDDTEPMIKTLNVPDIIKSINMYNSKEERKKIIKKFSQCIDTKSELCTERQKKDIYGHVTYDTTQTTGPDDILFTAGWMKTPCDNNNESFVSAWCNVMLVWPDDIIIENFKIWLKKTKDEYKPRQMNKYTARDIKVRVNKYKKAIIDNQLLQYLDIKILSVAMGEQLDFSGTVLNNEFKEIATKSSSVSKDKLLREIFQMDNEPYIISDFLFQSRE